MTHRENLRLITDLLSAQGKPALAGDAGGLRPALMAAGVNSRGWRLYCDIGDELFEPIGPLLRSTPATQALPNAIAFLQLVQACEMDVPPPRELAEALCRLRLPGMALSALPVYLFRAAWKECARLLYAGTFSPDWLVDEVLPVMNWLLGRNQTRRMDHNQIRANWSSFVRLHNDWLDQPGCADGTRAWAPLVRHMRCGMFTIEELTHERALLREGEAMHHCVANFVGACMRGEQHIFTITDTRTAQRIATLALSAESDGNWAVLDLKGPHNGCVKAMRGLMEAVLNLLRCIDDDRPKPILRESPAPSSCKRRPQA